MATLEIRRGDLLEQRDVEVIVNAWNRNFIPWWLLLPAGVSGAIKKRGGFGIFRELRRAGTLRAGDAVLTSAGRLPFRAIIHVAALTAVWTSSAAIVERCTRSALDLAQREKFASLALPLIGAGTGGVDPQAATEAIRRVVEEHEYGGCVVLVIFTPSRR